MNSVTQFDIVVLVLLLISAAVGFARGAMREIAALIALVAAAAVAIFGLRRAAPIAHRFIHTEWLALAATLIALFLVTYVLLRLIGGADRGPDPEDPLPGRARPQRRAAHRSGARADRAGRPEPDVQRRHAQGHPAASWIVGAATWPLAQDMGRMLTALAPKGLDIAGQAEAGVRSRAEPRHR